MAPDENDYVKGDSDVDAVIIDYDDVSNYNPDQILPVSPEDIQKIRAWLQPTSYDIAGGEYRKHLDSHVASTGAWLTSSDTYKQWLEDDQQGLLWIKGIPGSGKSVMAANIVDELSKYHPGSPVLFFFFRQIIEANHKPDAMLRDWMDQILNYSPPLQKKLKEYVDSSRSIESISMEDMWKDLYMSLSGLSGKAFCIADALDEMDAGNTSFLQAIAALGKQKPDKIKVLITSRPVVSVEGPLRNFPGLQIRLEEKMVDIDIATYVHFTLSRSNIPEREWKVITDAVPGRANGLFLYAKLAMDAFLEPCADIKVVLAHLPADLNVLYTDLLKEHSSRSGVADSIQRLILQAVTHAARPLRLLELAEMIKVNNPDGTVRDLKATKDLIRAACGPLLEILADETVSVIHHSFTEYLKGATRPDVDPGYPILQMGPTHAQLAVACLRYLDSGCLESVIVGEQDYEDSDYDWYAYTNGSDIPNEEIQTRLKHPFFDYAINNWSYHIKGSEAAEQDQTAVNAKIRQFLGDEKNMRAWIQVIWKGRFSPTSSGITQVHIAAKLGILSYLKELLQTMEPDVPDAEGKTPLWWAAQMGHASVIRELVKAGANPDRDDSRRGLKPLHKAASANHAGAVRVLLEAGVDPLTEKTRENPGRRCGNAPRTVGHTALMYACHSGHLEAVDAFIPFLKDLDTVHRALTWAAEHGRAKVVARILQYPGIDVNCKAYGDTPLYCACGNADLATIECLLKAGADPNSSCADRGDEFARIRPLYPYEKQEKSTKRNSCLHRLCGMGARRGYGRDGRDPQQLEAIFSLLVQAGVDIHQRSPSGQTALHGAINEPVLTKLLIQAGADVNATDNQGSAPLHSVISDESMALLIEEGHADLNIVRDSGETPLHTMLSKHHAETIKKFIEYGPDCNVVDNSGNGVLHITLQQWNTNLDIVKALINGGADPNLRNKAGLTPLLAMRDEIKPAILDLLIESGADINTTAPSGKNVLFNQVLRIMPYTDKQHTFKMLLDRGGSPFSRDRNGRTLLHEVVMCYENRSQSAGSPMFESMLGLGIDINAVDHDGNGLLHELALRRINHESYNGRPLVKFWEQLLGFGLDFNQANYAGLTPLHILCSADTSDARFEQGAIMPIDFVISNTKNLDKVDNFGATALHRAVLRGELYAKKLLEAGADPAVVTQDGMTPLHLASRSRQSNIVGLLLDELRKRQPSPDGPVMGVNVSTPGGRGLTPLYYACRSGRPETVSLLLQAGADIEKGQALGACLEFETEDALWKNPLQLEHDFKDPSQLPLSFTDNRRIIGFKSPHQRGGDYDYTPRLEEILEMLNEYGMNVSQFDTGCVWNTSFINSAFEDGFNYTGACMRAARDRNTVQQDDGVNENEFRTLFERLKMSSNHASIQAMRASEQLEHDKFYQRILTLLLEKREYQLVKEMAHLGVDFLATDQARKQKGFSLLVQGGYTSLVGEIGTIVAERGLRNGECHAFTDKTKPGFCFGKRPVAKDSYLQDNPVPFLLQAVQRELPNLEIVKLLVEKFGVDINEMHEGQYSAAECPLLYVSRGNHWWHAHQALPYLLRAGADINVRNSSGQTPLHMALKADGNWPGPFNREAAIQLIEAGADVNAVDENGLSCLACANHDIEIIKLLISHGAIVTAGSLFAAVAVKNVAVLQALLSGGADPNMRPGKPAEGELTQKQFINRNDWISTHVAESHEQYALYRAGESAPGVEATATEQNQKAIERSRELVQILLDHGADPFAKFLFTNSTNSSDPEEGTVIHQLFYDGKVPEVFLNIPKLDVNHRNAVGATLLSAACRSSLGPDYVLDSYKLHNAPDEKVTILERLISLGADLETQDNRGRNVLHYMINRQYKQYDTCKHSLAWAIKEAPKLIDQPDSSGETPLHVAASRSVIGGSTEIPEILIAAGADVLKTNKKGETVLHMIAHAHTQDYTHAMNIFESFVKRGIDINGRDTKGSTPLFVFCQRSQRKKGVYYESECAEEQLKIVPFLMGLGADVFVTNAKGRGLLHAAAHGHVDFFKKLMDLGLDVMLEDDAQQTPIDVAAASGNLEVLELFEKK